MSRDRRVFEVVEKQAYEQNVDRIRLLSAALRGLDELMWDYLATGDLSQEDREMVRKELIKSLVNNQLNNLSDEQIAGTLDKIEAELEINNEDN